MTETLISTPPASARDQKAQTKRFVARGNHLVVPESIVRSPGFDTIIALTISQIYPGDCFDVEFTASEKNAARYLNTGLYLLSSPDGHYVVVNNDGEIQALSNREPWCRHTWKIKLYRFLVKYFGYFFSELKGKDRYFLRGPGNSYKFEFGRRIR